jgi:dephospho-CoA kinase
MGKSSVSSMFARLGVPIFDADAQVHRLQGRGGALLPAIEARFPGSTGPAGVDRQKLGAMVLGRPDELRALERIIHPVVAAQRQAFLRRYRSRTMVVLDIPLLFEKAPQRAARRRAVRQADLIVTVSAPAWMQSKRVLRRRGMTLAKLKQIRALQMSDLEKCRRADVVIKTGCLRIETYCAVVRLVTCIRAMKGGYRRGDERNYLRH